MLKQYSVLSKCLFELKKSDLPIIDKLRIEVLLIQTKRILLDHVVERRVACVASSEIQFDNLYEQVCYVCLSGKTPEDLDRLKELLREVKEGLNFESNGRSVYSLGAGNDIKVLGATRSPPAGGKDIFNRR